MVEWKKLGEIANITIGEFVHRDKQNPKAKYPVYNGGTTYTGFYEYYNNTGNKIVISARGYAGFVNRVFDNYWAGNSSYSIDINNSKVLWHYVYYYLKNEQYNIMSMQQKGGGLAAISKKQVQELLIPIPSLSEQSRIVSILDTFTSSISNLKQQIEERRKQYEYERDLLLDLEGKEGVEMKKLGEVGVFIRGNGIQKADFVEEGYSCIHYGQIHARYGFSAKEAISKIEESLYKKCKKAKTGDVILATTSEDAEGVAKPFVWLGEEDVAVSGDAFIYHHNQIGKFMGYQFLTRKFMQFKVKYATGAKVVRISGDNMAKFEIPLPPLSTQSRIVSILDTFEQSISNLEEQLAMREKQYEYYRNQLLTFEGEEERGKT